MEDAEEGYQEAEAALEIMEEAEAEEAELEEVEDLLEYYLQRATTTQSEAERLLAGSRDLEESIGVSLSARRFEVSQLAELAVYPICRACVSSRKFGTSSLDMPDSALLHCHFAVLHDLCMLQKNIHWCNLQNCHMYCSMSGVEQD